MKNLKAETFNRKASDPRNKPDQIIEALELHKGHNVADIGAGGGYFSLRFAEAIRRKGKVYAVDTNPGFLEFIENGARERGLDNIVTTLVAEEDFKLPRKLNLVFLCRSII
jgi:precorrin-6B methylase 2